MTLAMVMGIVIGVPGITKDSDTNVNAEVTFKTQVGGVYDGMPLFDGNPEHLDAFVDTLFAYTGLEGGALYATGIRDNYTMVWDENPNVGKTIPGGLAAADNVQGISTDFPAIVSIGQTWNQDLAAEIGDVMGAEKISTLNAIQGTSNIHNGSNQSKLIAFTVVSDLRINPLSGRFDEGYAEDPYLAATLVDSMAQGLVGAQDGLAGTTGVEDDGFYVRAVVGTKHYSNYLAQWYRQTASNSVTARGLYEYQTRSAIKGLASGAVSGVMTSFGRTNGIPNIIMPTMHYANGIAKYGLYSSPDFNGENYLYQSFGNGYDTNYVPNRKHALALMVLANSESVRAMGTDKTDVITLVEAVEDGIYGITEADVYDAARPLVNQLVRAGVFDECDVNGIPKFYPYAQYAMDVTNPENLTNYETTAHQAIALKAAQESIVLLKNDGTLPLDDTQNSLVTGIYGDSRFKTTYAVGSTPTDDVVTDSGISPLLATIRRIGNEKIEFVDGVAVVAVQANNGEYLTAVPNVVEDVDVGTQLTTTPKDEINEFTDAQLFEFFDWGQEAFSLRSVLNGRWVSPEMTPPDPSRPWMGQSIIPGGTFGNTNSTALNLTDNDWTLETMSGNTSTIPPRLQLQENSDGTVAIVANAYSSGFGGGFENALYSSGYFVKTDEAGGLFIQAQTIGNAANVENITDDCKFVFEETAAVGDEAVAAATGDSDYAVIYVGAIPRNSAGEGADRSSLYMSDYDYELVEKVSAAFAAEGKKTVVVIRTSFPVVAEEIQNNENVNAIVYQSYGGQYDAKALAQVLYGDYAPTGRLTSTWYADMSVLPEISKYSIPEGNSTTLDQIDPRIQIDMTNGDHEALGLTYMYTEAPVTYEFGYGLSYSEFEYSNLNVAASATAEPFTVSVDVTNTGDVDTAEVVQFYISNNDSAYGTAAPEKQLIGYAKVNVAAGATATATVEINPEDFAIWDVNRGDFIVEDGTYTLMAGKSSDVIEETATIAISGESVAVVEANQTINVFDHSFVARNVIYRETSKQNTINSLSAEMVVGGYSAVMSKGAGAYVAIPNVNLEDIEEVTASVAAAGNGGFITLCADSPTAAPFAYIEVPQTEVNTYVAANTVSTDFPDGVTVNELGYVDVTANVIGSLSGIHDVYVVFKAADLRIDSLLFAAAAPEPTPVPTEPTPVPTEPTTAPTEPTETTPEPTEPTETTPEPTETTEPAETTDSDAAQADPTQVVDTDEEAITVDTETGTKAVAKADKNAFAQAVKLQVRAIDKNSAAGKEALDKIDDKVSGISDIALFDISALTASGAKIQPNADKTVTITMPVPAGFNPARIAVAHIKDDGTVEVLKSTVKDGMVTFTTSSFSIFAIMEISEGISLPKTGESSDSMTHVYLIILGALLVLAGGYRLFIFYQEKKTLADGTTGKASELNFNNLEDNLEEDDEI
jgi:beta-glucosidase-like glycosyl hydrolase